MRQFNSIGIEIISNEEWKRGRRHGYSQIWDSRRYMLRLDPETGATVYREVEVQMNVSHPYE